MPNLFQTRSYKAFLRDILEAEEKAGKRGITRKLSEAAGCHPTYLSQVLNGKPHLTLEQAYRLSTYFGHTPLEQSYWLDLVQHDRAGTPSLRAYLETRLKQHREENASLKNRVKKEAAAKALSFEQMTEYMGSWKPALVHLLLTIPEYQDDDSKIATASGLSKTEVSLLLKLLEALSLIQKSANGKWAVKKTALHLGNDSPHIGRHHMNLRMLALNLAASQQPQDLKYSSLISVSEDDWHEIKRRLVEMISELKNTVIAPSKCEIPVMFNIDFVRLGRP